ncbi:MAG TPA: STAS domain-containing protein [Terriglobales bacterium]|nr:STAS domain-containing protein [Terriglobales bacterium]
MGHPSKRLDFSVQVRGGANPATIVVAITGPLVLDHLVEIQDICMSRVEPLLIFDLSRLSYLDSAAVGFLVHAYVSRIKTGKTMALAGVSGTAKHILDIAHVSSLFGTYSCPEDAENALIGRIHAAHA